MNEKIKPVSVDFEAEKLKIEDRVCDEGLIEDIESWRMVFPEIRFMDVDETFSGAEIDWDKRTVAEKALFVAYMYDPQATRVSYEMQVDGIYLSKTVTNPENIWWMWLAGCFSDEELDERAIRTFLWNVDDGVLSREYIHDMDLEEVRDIKCRISVSPVK